MIGMVKIIIALSIYGLASALPECTQHDDNHCHSYTGDTKFYCEQGWIKENCRHMCDLCQFKRVEYASAHSFASAPKRLKPEKCSSEDDNLCDYYGHRICAHQWGMENCKIKCDYCYFEPPPPAPARAPIRLPSKDQKTECQDSKPDLCGRNKDKCHKEVSVSWTLFMKLHCKATCDLCPPAPIVVCTKNDDSYCSRYGDYVCMQPWGLENCQHKCGYCEFPKVVPPARAPARAPTRMIYLPEQEQEQEQKEETEKEQKEEPEQEQEQKQKVEQEHEQQQKQEQKEEQVQQQKLKQGDQWCMEDLCDLPIETLWLINHERVTKSLKLLHLSFDSSN